MENTEIFLKEFLTEPNNKVVLKLYNGAPPYEDQIDEYWEIKYKLMENDEEIEYYRERNEHARVGLVLEEIYYL